MDALTYGPSAAHITSRCDLSHSPWFNSEANFASGGEHLDKSAQQRSQPITLQGNVLGTRSGVWTIQVEHMRNEAGVCVLLLLLRARHLEQRRLILWLEEALLCAASSRELVAAAIREWIDSTEGDGQLDLRGLEVQG